MPLSIRGVMAPVTTPFRPDGSLDYEALGRNLVKWRATGLAGYVILGSTGEFVTLSADERRAVLEVARAHIPRDSVMIAGTGAESTAQAIAFVREAVRFGADAVMVVNPSYYKPMLTAEALYRHYVAVADASEIPVFLYNVPMFTGLNMDAPLVARLARHPKVVGIKDSSGDLPQLAEIIRTSLPGFLAFTGSAQVVLPALALGAAGAILQAAGFVPELAVQVVAFVVGSLASLLVLRPIARRHMRTPVLQRTGTAALVGQSAVVIDRVDMDGGRVKLAGEVWSACSYGEGDVYEPGARVTVVEISGATARVSA